MPLRRSDPMKPTALPPRRSHHEAPASLWAPCLLLLAATVAGASPTLATDDGTVADWPNYGRDAGGSRYSPLTQITPQNVPTLQVAWTYRTGDIADGSDATTGTRTS